MGLEGFWVFIFIVVASTFFIFMMTRGTEDGMNRHDDKGEITD